MSHLGRVDAEVFLEQSAGLMPGVLQIPGVVLTSQTEVRKVVQKPAKDFLAVPVILPCIKDVRVPELVNGVAGDDFLLRVKKIELEEHLIKALGLVGVFGRPALAFTLYWQAHLHLLHGEVQGVDFLNQRRPALNRLQEHLLLLVRHDWLNHWLEGRNRRWKHRNLLKGQ